MFYLPHITSWTRHCCCVADISDLPQPVKDRRRHMSIARKILKEIPVITFGICASELVFRTKLQREEMHGKLPTYSYVIKGILG